MTRSLLEIIGLVEERKPVVQLLVPHRTTPLKKEPNGKRQGTPAYKHSAVYIYCTPEDRRVAKRLAIDQGISMIELLHNLLTTAAATTGKTTTPPVIPADVRIMKASEFWNEFIERPIERWTAEQKRWKETVGDKK